MFESHYLKPFIVALGITFILISGMGFSLRGMSGTGAAHDAAEVSFHLPDDGESDAETKVTETVPKPEEKLPVETVTPEESATKATPLVPEGKADESTNDLNTSTKDLNASNAASSTHREWAIPKAIESEASSNEQAVVMNGNDSKASKSVKDSKFPIGRDITADPNADGNGFAEASDLSFLSDLAWSLLNPGQQALLQKPDINPQEYLKTVQEQGKRSIVTGKVVVRVNFDVNGRVIVGEHTPLIVDDVPQAVKEEALRIIKSSGSIINQRGEPVYLAVPVVLGQ